MRMSNGNWLGGGRRNGASPRTFTRRRFLTTAAAIAAPFFVRGSALGLAGAVPASERITLGCIGLGIHGMGWNLKNGFLRQPDARVLAVCDVYADRREAGRKLVNDSYGNQDCSAFRDWREIIGRDDIDAVMISTPDHWHAPMAAAALRAGKDVCCEKPTLTIHEGRVLIDLVRRHRRVFQTSTEDRSLPMYHRMAELVRNGRIGKLQTIRVTLLSGATGAPPKPAPVPAGFDYEMWLGPAPAAGYCANRCGAQEWRSIFDYSGGKFTDWGAHLLDTAQWANDTERSGPVWVQGKGDFPGPESLFNTATEYQLHYRYANGVELFVASRGTGIRFEGTDGWIECPAWRKPPGTRSSLRNSSSVLTWTSFRSTAPRLFTPTHKAATPCRFLVSGLRPSGLCGSCFDAMASGEMLSGIEARNVGEAKSRVTLPPLGTTTLPRAS